MGAVTATLQSSVKHSLMQESAGSRGSKGASIRVIKLTLPASYDQTTVHGSALSFASLFKQRVFWAIPITPFAINATTGAVCIGLVPGTAKTDKPGGFALTNWKVRAFATATESSNAANLSAYTAYIVACGV